VAAAVALLAVGSAAMGQAKNPRKPPLPPAMKAYDTKYYTLYTDMDADTVREACLRVTSMAEEYYRRTKDFSGKVGSRLPFYLFKNKEDYSAAGGPSGSAGVFMHGSGGGKLMAIASNSGFIWHVVQHEGFHQFAAMMITPRLPVWVNEGMAEYFGEGIWTGDGFVSGVIPPSQLKNALRPLFKDSKYLPLTEMLGMSQETWNGKLRRENYDQAWSMVHFLAHADDGKYQKAFVQFINGIAGGQQYEAAFVAQFGRNIDAFQKRWVEWWSDLPEEPTEELYAQATVQKLTSFLARAYCEKQKFADFPEFLKAAKDGSLKCSEDLWLPPTLLKDAVKEAEELMDRKHQARWSLDVGDGKAPPKVVLTMKNATVITGAFAPSILSSRQPPTFTCVVEKPKPATQPTTAPTAQKTPPTTQKASTTKK
jgi:hypothetical protein